MGQIENVIFELLKASLFGLKIELPEDIDWKSVYEEMKSQAVAALASEWFNSHPKDGEVFKEWSAKAAKQMLFYYKILKEQDSLTELLQNNSIGFVIIKGAAAAQYYPNPEARTMGDIDFLVKEEKYPEACELLKKNGYVPLKVEDLLDYHIELKKNGVVFELHKTLPIVEREKEREYLKNLLAYGLENPAEASLSGHSFPMMPTYLNGLVLLFHIKQHIKDGLGLRHIVDFMMFADKNLSDGEWEREFSPMLKRIGMELFTKNIIKMCKMYLGLREDITWCDDADEALCERLMEYVMKQGNFGRKMKNDKGARAFSRSKNPAEFLKIMQQHGYQNWELAQRHRFLKPFSWAFEACHYVKMAFFRKDALKELKGEMAEGKERREFFDSLGI